MLTTALLTGSGLFIALFGILIRYGGAVELVAGYDSERVDDPDGLADFVGTNLLYVALVTVIAGVLSYVRSETALVWLLYTVVVCAVALRLVLGSRRYERADSRSR